MKPGAPVRNLALIRSKRTGLYSSPGGYAEKLGALDAPKAKDKEKPDVVIWRSVNYVVRAFTLAATALVQPGYNGPTATPAVHCGRSSSDAAPSLMQGYCRGSYQFSKQCYGKHCFCMPNEWKFQ